MSVDDGVRAAVRLVHQAAGLSPLLLRGGGRAGAQLPPDLARRSDRFSHRLALKCLGSGSHGSILN